LGPAYFQRILSFGGDPARASAGFALVVVKPVVLAVLIGFAILHYLR
jgi:hypothetical protein